jgi:lipoate synthase
MGIQIIPILKAVAPLLAASSGLMGSLGERAVQARELAEPERIRKLEGDMLKMSQLLAASVQQLQATAEELRQQADLYRTQTARARQAFVISISAAVLALAALVVALVS